MFLEVVDGVEPGGLLPPGAADPEPGAVEVPEGARAHVGGEPGWVEVPRRVGVLHHVAVEAGEALRERGDDIGDFLILATVSPPRLSFPK